MGFGVGMLGPLYAVFAENVGGDILDITWVYALYLGIIGLGVLVVGKVADRIGNEKLLVAGYALSAVGVFCYIFVNSLVSLLLVQLLIGVARALWEPTWYALYDTHSGNDAQDGYIWGLASGLWYIVSAVAMLLGGYVVVHYSFDMLFLVMGCILTLSTLYTAQILQYRVQYIDNK